MFKVNLEGKEHQLRRLEVNDSNLTSAVFDTFPMYDDDIKRLIAIIKKNTHLTRLNLFDCRISRELMEPLSRAVLENQYLVVFNFDRFQDYSEAHHLLFEEVDAHLKENQDRSLTPGNAT